MNEYTQLIGALSALKEDGAALDWAAINNQLIDLGGRIGIADFGDPLTGAEPTGWADPVHEVIRDLARKYRAMCIERGLIRPGELFDWRDARPIVD